ncbi:MULTISPECIES: hypothetical protein [Oscillatoriales]
MAGSLIVRTVGELIIKSLLHNITEPDKVKSICGDRQKTVKSPKDS